MFWRGGRGRGPRAREGPGSHWRYRAGVVAAARMILLLLLLSGALARASAAAAFSRETVNFDLAWRFQAVAGSSAWPPADPSPSCAFVALPNPAACSRGASHGNAFASYHNVASADECKAQCCAMEECRDWAWTPLQGSGNHVKGGCEAGVCAPAPHAAAGSATGAAEQHALPASSSSGRKLPAPPPPPPPTTLNSTSPGGTSFDDASWEIVDVPHDMLMANGYSADAAPNRRRSLAASTLSEDAERASEHSSPVVPTLDSAAAAQTASPQCGWGNHNGCSYIPRGSGWYRKHFTIPADWKGHVVSVRFEGVFRTATAYLNGQLLAPTHTCGYTPIELRLDNVSGVVFGGGENVLAVFVDGSRGSGHWYEGAGIWRHVRLIRAGMLSIDHHAVFVQQQGLALSGGSSADNKAKASLNISVPLKHLSAATTSVAGEGGTEGGATGATITVTLVSPTGEAVASVTSPPAPQNVSYRP